MRTFVSVVAIASISIISVAGASATAPGANGKLAFSGYLDASKTTRAIFVASPDGSGATQLTHPSTGIQDQNPDWSSDGKWIAFSRCGNRCEVRIISAHGGVPRRVGPNCQRVNPPVCEDRDSPAWSPNGRTLAMDRGWGPVKHDTIEYSGLVLTDPFGGHVRRLAVSKPFWGDVKSAHWAPNGKTLVIEEDDSGWKATGSGKGHRALFVISANGTGLRQLTPWSLDAGDADWSPDGTLILFRNDPLNNDDAAGGNLYTMKSDGTGIQQLTHFGASLVLSSSFSPDGKSIVFANSGVGGAPDIYVMNADGTGVTPVTRTKLWESQPDWGPSAG